MRRNKKQGERKQRKNEFENGRCSQDFETEKKKNEKLTRIDEKRKSAECRRRQPKNMKKIFVDETKAFDSDTRETVEITCDARENIDISCR